MMRGVSKLARAAFLLVWIIPLAAQAGDEESVDIDQALEAVPPMLGLGGAGSPSLGDAPMPRVCSRYALQISRSLKLAQRAAAAGDSVTQGRVIGQANLIAARARNKCPQLNLLVDAAMDPKAIAGSHVCVRYAFQIAHYENMADRTDAFRDHMGDEQADAMRAQTLAHANRLRENAIAVCPEIEDDAVKKAKEFAKLMKLAAKAAISYFTAGTFPF